MPKFTMAHAVAIVGVWLAPAGVAFVLRAEPITALFTVCVGFLCAWFATICITDTTVGATQGAAEEVE